MKIISWCKPPLKDQYNVPSIPSKFKIFGIEYTTNKEVLDNKMINNSNSLSTELTLNNDQNVIASHITNNDQDFNTEPTFNTDQDLNTNFTSNNIQPITNHISSNTQHINNISSNTSNNTQSINTLNKQRLKSLIKKSYTSFLTLLDTFDTNIIEDIEHIHLKINELLNNNKDKEVKTELIRLRNVNIKNEIIDMLERIVFE
ncbi:hypothetical protein NAPIS_ORF02445 [Vairimorpha apis BRL 01]|uniref:Uncharacterized protein n=1 Tax=Vairimorpha apis BRL 01 TaxID=1037528 RepID=T0KXA4_9MICR|nr:hypothetical protein NAPIS_ORF02445 [Vairimorpha apis BRL 01]